MLTKQPIDISFAKGLDTKTDPKRVAIGNFVKLDNSVFTKGGLLQKRNGYGVLASLPSTNYSYLTTFNGNLTAVGSNIAAYNKASNNWFQKGTIQPLSIDTLPVLRNNLNQDNADLAVAPNGTACAVYLENNNGTIANKYVVFDSVTGQNLSAPAIIPVASGVVTGGMRVFVLENNFVIVFTNLISAVDHLQYITVNILKPSVVGANTDIASAYIPTTNLSWDAHVVGNNLYFAYNTTTGGQSVKVGYLTASQANAATSPSAVVTFATRKATLVTVTADLTDPNIPGGAPVIWVSFYRLDTTAGFSIALDVNLNTLLAATATITSGTVTNITSSAQGGVLSLYGEVSNSYSFSPGTGDVTNFIDVITVIRSSATVSSPATVIRSLGLASKSFIINGVIYFLGAYQSSDQSTYFLVDGSTSLQTSPVIAAKLAYSNGGGYVAKGLPGVTLTDDDVAQVAYRFQDLISAVNKGTALPTGSQVGGVYSQTGINLATFTFGTENLDTAEISSDLHISGGFLWMYDGYLPVEHNFFLWPDTSSVGSNGVATWSTTGGNIQAQPDGSTNTSAYWYQFTYEWTDNQGNAFRSAPSVPIPVTTSGSGTTGSITIDIPTLRLTAKTANPVKIVIYRWSAGQQIYYQTTSITAPILNDTTADAVQFVDVNADATILGNNIIYTNGGVIEDVNAPGSDVMALFDTRLWLVDAEDRNLLWFSKQCIEATPVEMSDLFTIFIPPTVGTATGKITAIFPMDDKLIISKGGNSFVYINGAGPDNTGANSQYSEPIFITSTVGCANQKSFVIIPNGLMFQSNKGIWLLGRDLSTQYIGAAVEDYTTGATVQSAVNIPEANQVRFTLDSGITLMYDYFYDQWSTFSGVPAVSSCIFENLHTFINSFGAAYQESPGAYLDGSNPVLMSFQTGPIRLGDLQNYQRAYFFYLLGTYISPHKILVSLAYDYETSPSQSILIQPTNYSTPYGSGASQSPYGQGNPYGGPSSREDWRVFLARQRCQAFSITLEEIFDSSLGTVAGAGFTLSGISAVCSFKRGFRPQPAVHSAG